MIKWIRLAFNVSRHGKHPIHRMGAVVLNGGKVVSTGSNLCRSRGLSDLRHHAEIRALRQLKNRGSVLVVVRRNAHNRMATMSRPCESCMNAIRSYGIRKIVYVGWDSKIHIEKVTP